MEAQQDEEMEHSPEENRGPSATEVNIFSQHQEQPTATAAVSQWSEDVIEASERTLNDDSVQNIVHVEGARRSCPSSVTALHSVPEENMNSSVSEETLEHSAQNKAYVEGHSKSHPSTLDSLPEETMTSTVPRENSAQSVMMPEGSKATEVSQSLSNKIEMPEETVGIEAQDSHLSIAPVSSPSVTPNSEQTNKDVKPASEKQEDSKEKWTHILAELSDMSPIFLPIKTSARIKVMPTLLMVSLVF